MTQKRDRPLAVCMVTTSYPRWEGDFAGHFVHSLAAALVARGHSVRVVAPHTRGAAPRERRDGVEIRRFRYGPARFERVAYGNGILANLKRDPFAWLGLPAFVLALRRATRAAALGADVVHAHWAQTAALAGAGRMGTPLVVTLHGSDAASRKRKGPGGLLRAALADADGVVAVAGEQVERLSEAGALDREKARVIPNGVEEALLTRERVEPGEQATILFVGRMLREKGADDLFEAFVMADIPNAKLRFVGEGPRLAAIRDSARALGFSQLVELAGSLPHEAALAEMAAATVVALPSHAEGCPLSVLEALALGVPVVGTSVGAIPDLLPAECIVAPGDLSALSRALTDLVSDSARRSSLGSGGRARIAECCTWPKIAARVEDAYDRAMERAEIHR